MTNPLLIAFLLDDSGSMRTNTAFYESTISGFNEYLTSLQGGTDEVYFGLWKFSKPGSLTEVMAPDKPENATSLHRDSWYPNGSSTALYDAIREMHDIIDEEKAKLELRTGQTFDVQFVIFTDGGNNAGATSSDLAMELNTRAEKDKNWLVVYMGVAADQYGRSAHLSQSRAAGVRSKSTRVGGQTASGTATAFRGLTANTARYRSARGQSFASGVTLDSATYDFFEEEVSET